MANNAKILPNSLEAEQGTLACILLDDSAPLNIFPVIKPDDFYSQAHKTIYETMLEIYASGKPVDFITLVTKLEDTNKLESVGGIEYITTLTNFLPSSANYKHYIDILKNHSKRRKLIKVSQQIIEKSFTEENSASSLNFAEKEIFEISATEQISSLEHIDPSLNAAIEKFDELAKNGGQIRGISTGLTDLDALTSGLQNSDLIILAARPGVGKTSLAMNIINNAAIKEKRSCAVFSLEMPREQIAQRSICSTACVSMHKALNGQLNDDEWHKIWKAKKDLSESKIFIDDNSLNTPSDILSKCRRLKLEHGLDLVMIDYLQLMKNDNNFKSTSQNHTLEIGEMTRTLKIAAKELNIPIILLSQLNRQVDSREDHRPNLADLRDSGSIEQDADIVMFIYNPEKYNDVVIESGQEGLVELEVAKHRNGSPGKIQLRWIGEWTKFVDKSEKPLIAPKRELEPQNIPGEEPPISNDYKNVNYDSFYNFDDIPLGDPPPEPIEE